MKTTISRRCFTFGSLAATLPAQRPAPQRKILIVLVDGFGPEYLESSEMPNLKRMGKEGAFKIGRSVMPSVTNVNNTSLVTASFPSEHGITANYQYDRATKTFSEMESSELVLRPTIFERARKLGMRTALVVAKDKVRTLCSRGADIAISAEQPDAAWVAKIGAKENMYSAQVNYWTLRAARQILRTEPIDLMYLSTTDYMMHTYAPGEAQSLEHLHTLDKMLAEIVGDHSRIEVYLTADHGMNAKSIGLNPHLILREKSIESEVVPIIKDRHQVHHDNLGGSAYVYLDNPGDKPKAMEILAGVEGVEEVIDAATAVRRFHLYRDRIGDLFLLAKKEYVFGDLEKSREAVKVRSHGSLHESQVPLFVFGTKLRNSADMSGYEYNLDLTRRLTLQRA